MGAVSPILNVRYLFGIALSPYRKNCAVLTRMMSKRKFPDPPPAPPADCPEPPKLRNLRLVGHTCILDLDFSVRYYIYYLPFVAIVFGIFIV